MITHGLFPTPVCFFSIDREITKFESKFIEGLDKKPNNGNTTSANRNVLASKAMTSIRSFIEKSLEEYVKEIHDPKNDVKFKITQSWMNYTEVGQFHHRHAHPNSFISGVFYPKTNSDDKIHFFKDDYPQIKLAPETFNLYNSESWWLPTVTGQLVIFPSSLTHMVQPIQGPETRISLSFNSFPTGYLGDEDTLTRLDIE